jgi:hypothetical protein
VGGLPFWAAPSADPTWLSPPRAAPHPASSAPPPAARRVYPGLLQIAAHAHAVVGFLDRDPAHVQTAKALLRSAGGAPSAEALVLRSVCDVLLGAIDDAVANLLQARKCAARAGAVRGPPAAPSSWFAFLQSSTALPPPCHSRPPSPLAPLPRAPLDSLLPWPTAAAVSSSIDEDPILATGMPVAQEAYSFVCARSRDDERGDLLPGLCLLTELWLSRVGFPMFPDTAADALGCSLSTYFNNTRVQQELRRAENAAVPAAAAGAIANTLAAVADGMQGQFGRAAAVVKAALQTAPAAAPAAAPQRAQAALREPEGPRRGGGAGGAPVAPLGGRDAYQQWDAAAAATTPGALDQVYPEQWPPAVVARSGAIDVAADIMPDAGGARGDGGRFVDDGGWGAARSGARAADVAAWEQQQAPAPRAPVAAVSPADRALAAVRHLVATRPAAAAAVGGVALAALALAARGGLVGGGFSAPRGAAGIASAAPTTATLDTSSAVRLVRAYQEARWRALGPDWDTAGLEYVAEGQALSHLRSQSDHFAARGWFQRFRLDGVAVGNVRAAGPGTARLEVTVRESSSMFGVDGRRAGSASGEYDVVYRAKRGGDGRWRISNFKVVGREPAPGAGGWLGRLFGR